MKREREDKEEEDFVKEKKLPSVTIQEEFAPVVRECIGYDSVLITKLLCKFTDYDLLRRVLKSLRDFLHLFSDENLKGIIFVVILVVSKRC